jgi:Ca2+-binding EF-hand superfamily protein
MEDKIRNVISELQTTLKKHNELIIVQSFESTMKHQFKRERLEKAIEYMFRVLDTIQKL